MSIAQVSLKEGTLITVIHIALLKELVQNAEDAGAQEMGILFDNRDNNRWAEDSKYNKHFKVCISNEVHVSFSVLKKSLLQKRTKCL